eukprot:TRINITY_DN9606_c0_g1_i1.p1 TRINITY_DN9606_c0_g1~~TRINITY_DN9606_c0_g1_i1.p1  ORF type:complete len:507 (-),score=54.11 TRINITY_DN9606_c0_g1_i1:58-1578(-)
MPSIGMMSFAQSRYPCHNGSFLSLLHCSTDSMRVSSPRFTVMTPVLQTSNVRTSHGRPLQEGGCTGQSGLLTNVGSPTARQRSPANLHIASSSFGNPVPPQGVYVMSPRLMKATSQEFNSISRSNPQVVALPRATTMKLQRLPDLPTPVILMTPTSPNVNQRSTFGLRKQSHSPVASPRVFVGTVGEKSLSYQPSLPQVRHEVSNSAPLSDGGSARTFLPLSKVSLATGIQVQSAGATSPHGCSTMRSCMGSSIVGTTSRSLKSRVLQSSSKSPTSPNVTDAFGGSSFIVPSHQSTLVNSPPCPCYKAPIQSPPVKAPDRESIIAVAPRVISSLNRGSVSRPDLMTVNAQETRSAYDVSMSVVRAAADQEVRPSAQPERKSIVVVAPPVISSLNRGSVSRPDLMTVNAQDTQSAHDASMVVRAAANQEAGPFAQKVVGFEATDQVSHEMDQRDPSGVDQFKKVASNRQRSTVYSRQCSEFWEDEVGDDQALAAAHLASKLLARRGR